MKITKDIEMLLDTTSGTINIEKRLLENLIIENKILKNEILNLKLEKEISKHHPKDLDDVMTIAKEMLEGSSEDGKNYKKIVEKIKGRYSCLFWPDFQEIDLKKFINKGLK